MLDFADQEALLLKALEIPSVQKRFKEQFKVLMVDEFQDTSPLQLSLFLKISTLVEKVIWVGDSKQAIYGFRGSDAQLITTVTAALDKPGSNDILNTSYRSTPDLVTLVNELFLPQFLKGSNSLSKEEIVLAPVRKSLSEQQSSFQAWGFNWTGYRSPSNYKYNSQLAARVALFIKEKPLVEDIETKTLRPLKAGDITILCRTNSNCRDVANALRRQGLEAVVADFGLHLTGEWRMLKACLHLLVDKSDSLSKAELHFLTSEDHEIETMLQDRLVFLNNAGEDDEQIRSWLQHHEVVKWIQEHRDHLLTLSISGIVQLIYTGLHFHERVMQWGGGVRRHANLDKILYYARSFEDYAAKTSVLPNVHGFLAWFDTLVDNEADSRGLITNEFSVDVLTYHGAKGLEWPVVLLYGLEKEHEPNAFEVRVHAKDHIDFKQPLADRSIRFWPWPYKSTYGKRTGYKNFQDCCHSSEDFPLLDARQRMESLRLLYVGFTRARDYLVIPFRGGTEQCWLKMVMEGGMEALGYKKDIVCDRTVKGNKIITTPFRLWVTSYDEVAEKVAPIEKEVKVYAQRPEKVYDPYLVNPSGAVEVEELTYRDHAAGPSCFFK